jgi:hypothetical protein
MATAKKAAPAKDTSAALKSIRETLLSTAKFEKDASLAFEEYGRDKKKAVLDARRRASKAFQNFSLSSVAASIQSSNLYVRFGEDVTRKQKELIAAVPATVVRHDARAGRRVRMRLTEEEARALGLSPQPDGRASGDVPLRKVMERLRRSTGGGALEALQERLSSCRVEREAARRFNEAMAHCAPAAESNPATSHHSEPAAARSTALVPVEPGGPPATSAALVDEQVARQMAHVTPPEVQLTYGVERNGKITATIQPGAADVTALHDFQHLKIAFESIWTEAFDSGLTNLGKQLYEEIVRKEEWLFEQADDSGTRHSRIQGVSDMRALVDDYRSSRASAGERTPVPSGMYDMIWSRDLDTYWPLLSEDQRALLLRYMAEFERINDPRNFGAYEIRRNGIRSEAASIFASMVNGLKRHDERMDKLTSAIDARLSERYKFDVFAPNSFNYGLLLTYRQAWEPRNYQVGELVSTLPLSPKEVRRYSTRKMVRKTRAQKELEDTHVASRSESSSTSRADSEIVRRARNATSFSQTAEGSVSAGFFQARFGTTFGVEAEKESADTKRNFREAVLTAAEEYRRQHKVEVETSVSEESESSASGEISNPNEEIAVTYLFYQLERQYRVSERLHRLTPVIMVANPVPAPNEVNAAWLMAHAWILRRAILDDSFLPALEYVTGGITGDELALDVLRSNMQRQAMLVDELINQMKEKTRISGETFQTLKVLMGGSRTPDDLEKMGQLGLAMALSPYALIFGDDPEKREEVTKMAVERADKETHEVTAKLTREVTALKEAVDKYTKFLKEHFDRQAAIARLRMHVKDNILYYMHAIWDYEPTDQRLLRLYNLEVDWFEPPSSDVRVRAEGRRAEEMLPGAARGAPMYDVEISLPFSAPSRVEKKLSEVADLDTPLGYKGNYMIFPVKDSSYLHWYMMQDYVHPMTGGLRDPDEFAKLTTEQLLSEICCLRETDASRFAENREALLGMVKERLASFRPESDIVIVPSGSLYIEALPGKHPVLEDFKLVHRAIDVKKVQAEVRSAELENLRLAARLLEGERDDPDIERKVVVQGGAAIEVPAQ